MNTVNKIHLSVEEFNDAAEFWLGYCKPYTRNGMIWFRTANNPQWSMDDCVGIIPSFLSAGSELSFKDQIINAYVGTWYNTLNFEFNVNDFSIRYPEDPKLPLLAMVFRKGEAMFIYPSGWVMIIQQDMTFEISRVD